MEKKNQNLITSRPPIVVVLGHIDHGKSSLLEAIRDFKITEKGTNTIDIEIPKDIKNADIVIGIRSSSLIIASLFKNALSWCNRPPQWFSDYNIRHIGPGLNGLGRILKEQT